MNSRDQCMNVIREVLREQCDVDPQLVNESARLQADLNLDSVGLLSLALELENRFEIYLGEDTSNPPQTVGDVLELLIIRLEELRDAG